MRAIFFQKDCNFKASNVQTQQHTKPATYKLLIFIIGFHMVDQKATMFREEILMT